MKNIVLKIFLIVLVVFALGLTYIKFFYKLDILDSVDKSRDNLGELNIYHSYRRETYDANATIIEESDNTNYVIKMNKKNFTICTLDPEECLDFEYEMFENQFVMKKVNKKILDAKLEFYDINNEIQAIKKYETDDDGYTIFYFEKI